MKVPYGRFAVLFTVAAEGLLGAPGPVTLEVMATEVGADGAELNVPAADAAEAETGPIADALIAEEDDGMALGSVKCATAV